MLNGYSISSLLALLGAVLHLARAYSVASEHALENVAAAGVLAVIALVCVGLGLLAHVKEWEARRDRAYQWIREAVAHSSTETETPDRSTT